jgi:hypothetical protein
MSLPIENPGRLLSPREAIDYLAEQYGLPLTLPSLYSMISRGDAPKVTYFRNRPKFKIPDLDSWVRNNLSDNRK